MIAFLHFLVRLLYRYRIYNPDVLKTPGPVLLLPNHTSWWDWLLIGVCLDEDWRFVTSAESAETSWVHKKIMINRRTFPVDINSAYAVRHMAEYLQKGGRLVLFPEGRLSRTGSLMKLFDGTGFLIFKTHAKVITAYLRGAYRLPFSPNTAAKRWWPRLTVHFSQLLTPPELGSVSVTEARHRLTYWLQDQMVRQQFETEMQFGSTTVPGAILESARQQPGKVIFQDSTMQKVTYRRLIVGASLLADQWRKRPGGEARIGLLLPNVNAFPVVMLSLWFANKTPAILNYTSGVPIVLTCAQLAGLKQVITSRAFLEHFKLDLQPLKSAGIEIVFLEDTRSSIPAISKFWTALKSRLNLQLSTRNLQPGRTEPGLNPESRSKEQEAPSTAVVLFTSGSEGVPKGVELTHHNLLANIRQMLSVIDLWESDRFFNALPLFHSFGLTVGLLLPLIQRVFVFLYVSPLHYRVVPSAFYNLDCSIFFGTNTFLSGYARKAHPYDFRTLRYVFAGAEKLQEHTSTIWARKFGVRILEGYGVTECSPCISANTPQRHKFGSAGQFLPDIEHRVEQVEGINEEHAGRLFVRGPNIMRGYLNPEANEKFKVLNGWYDTGDIARVDSEGYLFILGRLKRFAKISGEMVSLAAIEDALAGAFPEFGLKFAAAVAAKKDEAKGEKLVLITNEARLTIDQAREAIRRRGLSNLAVPREIKVLPDIPRLGTGKVNHRELEKLV